MYVIGLYVYIYLENLTIKFIIIRGSHVYDISLLIIFLREIITTHVRPLVPLAASIRNYWMVCI